MAPKLDFRKPLRAIATRIQAANQARLLSGQTVSGDSLAPRVEQSSSGKASKRRVRVSGIRVKLSELTGNVGVASGALLKDLVRASNVKLGRTSFKIIPSPEVLVRMFCFVGGSLNRRLSTTERKNLKGVPRGLVRGGLHQAPRPFSGIPGEILDQAAAELASAGNEQLCAGMQGDLEEARASTEAD